MLVAFAAQNRRLRPVREPLSGREPHGCRRNTAPDHFFNHQTHHRGQLHCLLTMLTGNAPSLDLILFQREPGLGARTNA